jgi:hypothetical protein
LGFKSVPVSVADTLTVPEGYSFQVMAPWGDPVGLSGENAAFKLDASNTAAEQETQLGMHHDGIHFFKTEPQKSIDIIMKRYTNEGQLNRHQAAYIYNSLKNDLEPNLYPNMKAISNVYEEAKHEDADAQKVNPMELWDLHHLRGIDDSGYVRNLYECKPIPVTTDRDELAQRQSNAEAIVREVKKCGHLLGVACGCSDTA